MCLTASVRSIKSSMVNITLSRDISCWSDDRVRRDVSSLLCASCHIFTYPLHTLTQKKEKHEKRKRPWCTNIYIYISQHIFTYMASDYPQAHHCTVISMCFLMVSSMPCHVAHHIQAEAFNTLNTSGDGLMKSNQIQPYVTWKWPWMTCARMLRGFDVVDIYDLHIQELDQVRLQHFILFGRCSEYMRLYH